MKRYILWTALIFHIIIRMYAITPPAVYTGALLDKITNGKREAHAAEYKFNNNGTYEFFIDDAAGFVYKRLSTVNLTEDKFNKKILHQRKNILRNN